MKVCSLPVAVLVALVGVLLINFLVDFPYEQRVFELAFRGDLSELQGFLIEVKGAHADDPTALTVDAVVNLQDQFGNTPLLWAAKGGDFDTVQFLLSKSVLHNGVRASVANLQGSTALHWAAYNGTSELIELLLAEGIDIHAQSQGGETALHWAVDWNNEAATRTLLTHDANPNIIDARGNTPLHNVGVLCDEDVICTRIVAYLVASGADTTLPNDYGRTPLQHFDISANSRDYDEEDTAAATATTTAGLVDSVDEQADAVAAEVEEDFLEL
jgi:ankyrin repeat protein